MREWNSKFKGLKKNPADCLPTADQVVFSYLCVETPFHRGKSRGGGCIHPTLPKDPPSLPLTEGDFVACVYFCCLFPHWAFSLAPLLNSPVGFYGRADHPCEPTVPAGPEEGEPAPPASLRGSAASAGLRAVGEPRGRGWDGQSPRGSPGAGCGRPFPPRRP